jgi:general transcription factor 3C polypeptide 3 (transcription factor C subunit 4)
LKRGPRKAAEPTGDIKFRLSKASQAYIERRFDDAIEMVQEIIRINAEIFESWTLMASIFEETGQMSNAFMALVSAAHLRPKDVSGWLRCAEFGMQETGEDVGKHIGTVKFCYSSAVRADPMNPTPRIAKAEFFMEQNNREMALKEFRMVLKLRPHDLDIIRQIAILSAMEAKSPKQRSEDMRMAITLYRESFDYYKHSDTDPSEFMDWGDVNIYTELYGQLGEQYEGIQALKSVARWLLGRQEEVYWDEVTQDDREFDRDDFRRIEIPAYVQGKYNIMSYGNGLAIELHVTLGLYRLSLGHHEEAMVSACGNILSFY